MPLTKKFLKIVFEKVGPSGRIEGANCACNNVREYKSRARKQIHNSVTIHTKTFSVKQIIEERLTKVLCIFDLYKESCTPPYTH